MSDRELPLSLREGISAQRFGKELLIYDERTHTAFCLNASAAIIWELADGTRSLDQLAELASIALDSPLSREFVSFILEELDTVNLLQPAQTRPHIPISRRSALRKLGAGCAALFPVIASITAPTAAQAYSGCVDCSVQPGRSGPNIRRRARRPSQ